MGFLDPFPPSPAGMCFSACFAQHSDSGPGAALSSSLPKFARSRAGLGSLGLGSFIICLSSTPACATSRSFAAWAAGHCLFSHPRFSGSQHPAPPRTGQGLASSPPVHLFSPVSVLHPSASTARFVLMSPSLFVGVFTWSSRTPLKVSKCAPGSEDEPFSGRSLPAESLRGSSVRLDLRHFSEAPR